MVRLIPTSARRVTRARSLAPTLVLLALAGCAQSASWNTRTTMGTLKTRVAQLEQESAQQRQKIAEITSKNRRLANRLSDEEAFSGELSARLDDARHLLSQQGIDTETLSRSPSSRDLWNDDDGMTLPAGRVQRPSRKPPFAEIRGSVETLPEERDSFESDPSLDEVEDYRYDRQSRLERPRGSVWLPIANSVSEPASPRR